jgi:hypothetical protein
LRYFLYGKLGTPEDFFLEPFTVSGGWASTITIQRFGFGGGTNAAGTAIPAGGFDSLVALFKRHVFLTIYFSPDDDPERARIGAFRTGRLSARPSTRVSFRWPHAGI